jgi:hypothetical protein
MQRSAIDRWVFVVLAACGTAKAPARPSTHAPEHGPQLPAAELAGDLEALRSVFEEAHAADVLAGRDVVLGAVLAAIAQRPSRP